MKLINNRLAMSVFLAWCFWSPAIAENAIGADREPSGVDVFIEACRWQGLNPTMIRTGYAEFDVTVSTQGASEIEIQKEIDNRLQALREFIDAQSDERVKANLLKAKEQIPDLVRARRTGIRRSRVKALFDGNDSTFGKRRSETINLDPATNEWEQPLLALRRALTKTGDDNVQWDKSAHMAIVSKDPIGMFEFQAFGRMQGFPSKLAVAALLNGTSTEQFEFQLAGIDAYKEQIAKLESSGKATLLHITGEAEYDGGAVAYVVESRVKTASGSQIAQRYWIDASRAYICPLIEMYGPDERLAEAWTSSDYFLHEKSGLWFPTKHVHTKYVSDTGNVEEQTTYQLDRLTVRINQTVAEEEFAIQVPVGANVLDARGGKQINYKASAPVTLSLAKGGLDLGSMEGLGIPAPPSSLAPRSWLGAAIGLLALPLLLLVVFFLRPLKRWRGRAGAACALFCLLSPFAQGDSHAQSGETKRADSIVVEPKTLDFGRMNEANGPLKLHFNLVNRGDQAIKIKGLRPGCGCTVAKLNASDLPAHEHLKVPLTVNIHGRLGKFATEVLVDLSGTAEPLRVPLQGTIVKDLWYSGQAIICSAADSEKTVETTFEVSTVDWPKVAFDWNALQKGISVKEISRSKEADETVIKFRLLVDVPDDHYSTTRLVVLQPRDKRTRPLTIPVVCYRPSLRFDGAGRGIHPDRISLGAIPLGESRKFRIFGSAELIKTLKIVGFDGIPDDCTVDAEVAGSEETDRGALEVTLTVGEAARRATINGRLRLKSPEDGREYSVVVLGLVRPRNAARTGRTSE